MKISPLCALAVASVLASVALAEPASVTAINTGYGDGLVGDMVAAVCKLNGVTLKK